MPIDEKTCLVELRSLVFPLPRSRVSWKCHLQYAHCLDYVPRGSAVCNMPSVESTCLMQVSQLSIFPTTPIRNTAAAATAAAVTDSPHHKSHMDWPGTSVFVSEMPETKRLRRVTATHLEVIRSRAPSRKNAKHLRFLIMKPETKRPRSRWDSFGSG
jgi:hypothetical protein